MAEEEVFVATTTNLQVDHMTHVLEVFHFMHLVVAYVVLLLASNLHHLLLHMLGTPSAHVALDVSLLEGLDCVSSVVVSGR